MQIYMFFKVFQQNNVTFSPLSRYIDYASVCDKKKAAPSSLTILECPQCG